MESEYARIPIAIGGKIALKRRKEEVEYELDLVEKYIGRVKKVNKRTPAL